MLAPQLTHVPLAERQAMRDGPRDSATHQRLAAATPALGQIEIGGKASRESAGETLTVVALNVERLCHGDAIAATLAGQAPDVVLLSEVDEGMAHSGNGHPLRVLADRLGHAFAYGVESSSSAAATRLSGPQPARSRIQKAPWQRRDQRHPAASPFPGPPRRGASSRNSAT
ncbi:hypothetical protein [Mesorhizobium sp. Root695]|uniref:hypothetical protein n=1 Tax=Mesorhizobium sp. Root695 TaxID=1736589 RepID=UPI001FCDAB8F|nr:hypothetical protein [Mesorhizobium sp. Root695]